MITQIKACWEFYEWEKKYYMIFDNAMRQKSQTSAVCLLIEIINYGLYKLKWNPIKKN